MGERDSGASGCRVGGADPRNDFKWDVFREEGEGLFTAPSEDEWVSPFETDDDLSHSSVGDHQTLDPFLFIERRMPAALTDVDVLGIWGMLQEGRINQTIIKDDISLRQGGHTFQRDQFRITRTGSNYVNSAFHLESV